MSEPTHDPPVSFRPPFVARINWFGLRCVGLILRAATGLLCAAALVPSVLGASNCKLQDTSGYCQLDCEKTCRQHRDDICVSTNDPAFGCASANCEPCALAHAESVCGNDGRCVIGGCATGHADCDDTDENGCETDYTSSIEHCGACNKPCPRIDEKHALFECSNGLCVIVECVEGYQNCNKLNADGCEAGPEIPCDPSAVTAGSTHCK